MAKKVTITAKPNRPAGDTAQAAEEWVTSGKTATASEGMKRFTIDVPESLHRRIKIHCAAQGLKMADEIRVLLDKHFPSKTVE